MAAMEVHDPAYEFDAPQYYDFTRRASTSSQAADAWFDNRHGTPEKGPIVLADVVNKLEVPLASGRKPAGTSGAAGAGGEAAPTTNTTSKKTNIVTSWGANTAAKATQQAAAAGHGHAPATAAKPATGTTAAAVAKTKDAAAAPAANATAAKLQHVQPATHDGAAPSATSDAAAAPAMQTRSVSKKTVEEAALQHASTKAQKQRQMHKRSVQAALSSARRSSRRQSVKAAAVVASTTTALRAKAAAARASRGAAASKLAGAVVKPTRAGTAKPRASGSAPGNSNAARSRPQAPAATARAGASSKPTRSAAVAATTKQNGGSKAASAVRNPPVAAAPRAAAVARAAAPVLRGSAVWAGRLRVGAHGAAAGAASKGKGRAGGQSKAVAAPAGTAQERLKRALQPATAVPRRSTRPLTLPDEPDLHTSKRARKCPPGHCAAADVQEEGAGGAGATPFKPLAVKVMEFQRKTPARFKSKPTPADPPRPLAITHPTEPHLQTAARARPSTLKPREVEEEEALAALPAFHALPLRPELLKTAPQAHKPEPRAPTEPMPFNFVSDDRAARRQRTTTAAAGPAATDAEDGVGPVPQFKARPLNTAILEAPAHVPKKARMSLTVPVSPLLATKARAHEVRFEEERQEFRARPVPSFLLVPQEFQAREAPPLTEPHPFKLRTEQRGSVHQQKLQARLAQEQAAEAEARAMHALQLPPALLEGPSVPPRPEPKPLTVPEPFTLQSLARHGEFVSERQEQLAAQEAQAKAEAVFKARPMWQGIPYQLHPSDTPLTVPEDVHLATEQRATERSEFDAAVHEKMSALEAAKVAAAEEAARQEEEARREYRRSLRFKAQPMPTFGKPFAPAPSSRPLTQARTPPFGRKRKVDEAGGQQ